MHLTTASAEPWCADWRHYVSAVAAVAAGYAAAAGRFRLAGGIGMVRAGKIKVGDIDDQLSDLRRAFSAGAPLVAPAAEALEFVYTARRIHA